MILADDGATIISTNAVFCDLVIIKNTKTTITIASASNINPIILCLDKKPKLETIAKEAKIPVSEVYRVFRIASQPISLENPIGDDGETMFEDFIQDKKMESPISAVHQSLLKDQLQKVLNTLNHREREVIKLRFGIGDGYTHTLEEIGERFNITRERIRQIETVAIRKLQHPLRSRKLEGFLEGVMTN